MSALPGDIFQPLDDGLDPARVGIFELRALIGQGGMARVYLGVSTDGTQVAAIKTIKPGVPAADQDEFRVRLWRERNAYQRMRGFRTPPWYADNMDGRELPGTPWIAIGYVPAPSLERLVRTAGPLPMPVALRLVEKLSGVLIRLEERGLVHRDVTQANVLVSRDAPWLVDFGLVMDAENPSDRLATDRKGSAGYAAPEHARAEQTTIAADVYAVGRLLHFAATGIGPTRADGAFVRRRPDGTPDLRGLPDDVYRLVADCMHEDPARRPTPQEIGERARRLADEADELEAVRSAHAAYPPGTVTSVFGRLPEAAARLLEQYELMPVPKVPLRGGPVGAARAVGAVGVAGVAGEAGPDVEAAPTRAFTGRDTAPVHVAGGVLPGRPDPGALTRIAPRWTAELPGRVYYATPLPYRGRLLVAGLDGTVLALNPATGDRLWGRSLGAGVECPLAAGDPGVGGVGGVVVAGCADRTVRGLAVSDGTELWRYATDDTVPSTPAVFGGLVCVGDREGGVHALEAASGAVRWQARVDGRGVYGPPAISPDGATVYVTAWDGRLYAFDAATGARRWASDPHGELHGGPAVHGDRVFTGSRDHHLRAFDAATGRELWRSPTTGAVRATPLVHDGRVWAGCMGGGLYGVPVDGTADRAVRVQTGVPVRSAVAAQRGWVLAGGADGHIHAFHAASGEHRRWYAADAPLDGGVATAGDLVFTASVECVLHAVNAISTLPERPR